MFRNKRLDAIEVVLDAVIELLRKKQVLTREDIQKQIIEDSTNSYIDIGGIVYKVDKNDKEIK